MQSRQPKIHRDPEVRCKPGSMARFYVLSVEPTLFAETALVRRWGRIGTAGRQMIDLHPSPADRRDRAPTDGRPQDCAAATVRETNILTFRWRARTTEGNSRRRSHRIGRRGKGSAGRAASLVSPGPLSRPCPAARPASAGAHSGTSPFRRMSRCETPIRPTRKDATTIRN